MFLCRFPGIVKRVEFNPSFKFTAKLWRGFTHERNTTAEDENGLESELSVAAKKCTILAGRKRRWSGYGLARSGGGAGPRW